MFFRRNTDKLVIPLIFLAVLGFLSYRPKYHLRTEMPPRFFPEETASGKPSLDQKIAWAYWESAQMNVQWKYGYGIPLPPDPPQEFQIQAKALGPGASDPTMRLLYWHRLRQVWGLPETWQKDYQFDLSWASNPVTTVFDWIRIHTTRLLRD
jgi:hypothetical protein